MRNFVFIFLLSGIVFGCVKQKTNDPIPVIEFKDFKGAQRLAATETQSERDTATLVIGYQDGDGDLFVNSVNDGPNFVYTTYYFDTDSNKFLIDGTANSDKILQPADGYYKGKSVEGDIERPLKEFRSTKKHKVLKFEVVMQDLKGHKSNVVTSPVYTLTF